MGNRTGTYVAFHAEGSSDPTASDIKYYRLLKAWHINEDTEFSFTDSHEKTAAVRDTSSRATLLLRLKARLRLSKNMVLIIGKTTRYDRDWVPFEIEYAIDSCAIPIIAAYPDYEYILSPGDLSHLWPIALAKRINDQSARIIHIPFKQEPIKDAVRRFSPTELPPDCLSYYTIDAYKNWGIVR